MAYDVKSSDGAGGCVASLAGVYSSVSGGGVASEDARVYGVEESARSVYGVFPPCLCEWCVRDGC